VDSTLEGFTAAAEAGLRVYRYGSSFGLRHWLEEVESDAADGSGGVDGLSTTCNN
jgi:hypothetical protein